MRFQLTSVFYATALVAAAVGAFEQLGFFLAAIFLGIWAALFSAAVIDFTLPTVGALMFQQYEVAFYCGGAAVVCTAITAVMTTKTRESPLAGSFSSDA